MYVKEIWRYPVKSMAGELLDGANITALGIGGDRVVQARDSRGRTVTSRTHPALLGHKATTSASGLVMIDGLAWDHPDSLHKVREIAGPGATLAYDEAPDRFDILPLLVATDGAIAAFGRDRRRLRPNLVIGGVEGLEERAWEGRELAIGEVRIRIHGLRGRCVMTTFDPDTLEQDRGVLTDIVRRFGGKLALNCEVTRGGTIRTGAAAEVF